jgi:hypothetical protein
LAADLAEGLIQFDSSVYQISLSSMKWFSLTGNIQGIPPSPRQWSGFAAVRDKLIVFGGSFEQGQGTILNFC